jgi:hypothetical protein
MRTDLDPAYMSADLLSVSVLSAFEQELDDRVFVVQFA